MLGGGKLTVENNKLCFFKGGFFMYSKNNVKMNAEKKAVKAPKYGLAKLSVGVASVLLGTTLVYGGANAKAATTPANAGELPTAQTSSASTSSATASSEAAKVTSADVQSASATASAAASNADANKANVQSASDALSAAKSANQGVANVKDALASANAAISAENEALNSSYKAADAESAAASAYNSASDYLASHANWQSAYNNFRAEAETNAKTLASAQAKQAAAQKQVDELSAAVKVQDSVIASETAAEKAANDELWDYKQAGITSGADYEAAQQAYATAQQAVAEATALKQQYAGKLADWQSKLAAAKAATKEAQKAVDYDNGVTSFE